MSVHGYVDTWLRPGPVEWDVRVNIHLVKGVVCQPPGPGCWTSRSTDPTVSVFTITL